MLVNDDSGGASPGSPTADGYDLLPYPSMPYTHTQPARLAAVAALHGIEAPDAENARVLELGCASGGNIIPLAARYPRARFLGVDLSRRHVEDAHLRISGLGLGNIEVRQGDLSLLSFGGDTFDYVICHGVFSWVAQAAQDGILRICRDSLSRGGLALISYNVLPGWHLRRVIRDICVRHVGPDGSPKQRVAKARAILADLAAFANEAEPYGLLLRNEARRTAHRPASYILGEFLVADNSPCYFTDFVGRAAQHDLTYVCEGDLEASVPETLSAKLQSQLRASAGPDPLAMEQYADYFTGRTFRCSVLTKAGGGAKLTRDYRRLQQLHISSDLRHDPGDSESDLPAYRDARGRAIKSRDPAVQRALARLAGAYPETMSFDQIVAPHADGDPTSEAGAPLRVRTALSLLVAAGQADVSTAPLRVGRASAVKPRVWALARAEAATGQPWVTAMTHAPVSLKPAMAVLLPHLDGSNDHQRLEDILADALREGEVHAPELQPGHAPSETPQKIAAQYLSRVLGHLAANALLEPNEAPL